MDAMCALEKSFEDIVRWRWSVLLGKVVCVAPSTIADRVCRQSLDVHCVRLPASGYTQGRTLVFKCFSILAPIGCQPWYS